jgi:aminoglycoside phosphotransferase (APT) family kinase protein
MSDWFGAVGAALQQQLRQTWPSAELSSPVTVAGGRSGVTLTARLRGAGPERDVVIKAAPPGRPPAGRHDVLRQAAVLDALAVVEEVVTPRVLATCGGTAGTHTAFAMERASGEAVEPVLDAADTHLPPELIEQRARRAARMLAALHAVDLRATDVTRITPRAAVREELDRWSATAAAADPAIAPGVEDLYERLRESVPSAATQPVLVHGDYRLGNIVFDGAQPTGLIDWEIWGVTHPGVDLGWFLVFCDADAFPGIGVPVVGMPSAGELLWEYREGGGTPPLDTAWFDAFGRFKMAAIMAHNLRRHREGRHHDPFQERLPPTIRRLIETGLERTGRRIAL